MGRLDRGNRDQPHSATKMVIEHLVDSFDPGQDRSTVLIGSVAIVTVARSRDTKVISVGMCSHQEFPCRGISAGRSNIGLGEGRVDGY